MFFYCGFNIRKGKFVGKFYLETSSFLRYAGNYSNRDRPWRNATARTTWQTLRVIQLQLNTKKSHKMTCLVPEILENVRTEPQKRISYAGRYFFSLGQGEFHAFWWIYVERLRKVWTQWEHASILLSDYRLISSNLNSWIIFFFLNLTGEHWQCSLEIPS